MRAAVMRRHQLYIEDVREPEPGPGQVLVKTLACGICGSDLHALKFADQMVEAAVRSGAPKFMDPDLDIVMGHEFCAEILDHGPETHKGMKPGTRVCSMPITFGPGGIKTVGYSNDVPGGYAERMILNEMLLLEVPNGLSTEHATLTEPMAVGLHAVEKSRLQPDDVPLVIGCGPVGLAVIAALKLKGASPIIAADFSPKRRALAEALGADIVVDPGAQSPYSRWRDIAFPAGFDPASAMSMMGMGPQPRPGLFFECVGIPGIIQQILEGAPRQARAVVVGVCMQKDQIEPAIAINKELNLQFVLGYTPLEFAQTLRHIAEGEMNVAPMVTGKVGIAEVPEAFVELANPDRHAKILVEPWR